MQPSVGAGVMYNITSSEVYYFAEGFLTVSEATNLKHQ